MNAQEFIEEKVLFCKLQDDVTQKAFFSGYAR